MAVPEVWNVGPEMLLMEREVWKIIPEVWMVRPEVWKVA